MKAYFRRQLANYVEYHRDRRNCMMHVFGIVFLFLGAVLPFSFWRVPVLGAHPTLALVLALPVLTYWILLDVAVGLAILGAATLLLSTATMIVNHTSVAGVWWMAAVLVSLGIASQIIGHQVFERRQPSLMDNPAHLLLGPMFVMAKLFISLGFRRDLAVVIEPSPQPKPTKSPPAPSLRHDESRAEPHLRS
jgi:uncharacterized membrane protein YGL010W